MTEHKGGRGTEQFYRRIYDISVCVFGGFCLILVWIAGGDPALVAGRTFMCIAPVAGIFVAGALLRRFPASPVLWTVRYSLPLFFLTFYFRLTGQIFPFLPEGFFDDTLVSLEKLMFGDPKLGLHLRTFRFFSSPLVGEVMCLVYLLYYAFLPVFGGRLIIRELWRKRGPSDVVAWYVVMVAVSYFLHYSFFFLFPAQGPAFYFVGEVEKDPGFLVSQLHHFVVSHFDVRGGAFPSSHVSIALLHVFIAAHLKWRNLCIASIVVTAGICLATVYTQAHYAVDSAAGLVSGFLCWIVLSRIFSASGKT